MNLKNYNRDTTNDSDREENIPMTNKKGMPGGIPFFVIRKIYQNDPKELSFTEFCINYLHLSASPSETKSKVSTGNNAKYTPQIVLSTNTSEIW